ncbi:MAG: MraY family glycosyltransferase [Coriobacteriia bacterium]
MQYSTILVSAALSALSMPIIIGIAKKKKLYDTTGGRKIHSGMIPRLGGVGMFWAFFIALGLVALFENSGFLMGLAGRMSKLLPLAIGAAAMHFLGLADDLHNLSARRKFAIQAVIAFLVVGAGFRFRSLSYGQEIFSGPLVWISYLVTWGWIVGMTNAVNLIDGMDGLAGGIVAIVAAAFSGFYVLEGELPAAFICFALAGVVLGFLCFNFPAPKAKLFMGDSGSLFLGFALSVMPFLGQTVSGSSADPGAFSPGILPSLVLLAIPMIDTLRAIVRRLGAGTSIGIGDRKHVHHLLLDYGYRPRQILKIVYFVTLVQALIFVVARTMPMTMALILTCMSLAIVGSFFFYVSGLSSKET